VKLLKDMRISGAIGIVTLPAGLPAVVDWQVSGIPHLFKTSFNPRFAQRIGQISVPLRFQINDLAITPQDETRQAVPIGQTDFRDN
jgi:hypothetical protein